jgi:hypothetical protein
MFKMPVFVTVDTDDKVITSAIQPINDQNIK